MRNKGRQRGRGQGFFLLLFFILQETMHEVHADVCVLVRVSCDIVGLESA